LVNKGGVRLTAIEFFDVLPVIEEDGLCKMSERTGRAREWQLNFLELAHSNEIRVSDRQATIKLLL
jgi:hypothetical protein